jgi:hypothetical protein
MGAGVYLYAIIQYLPHFIDAICQGAWRRGVYSYRKFLNS